MAGNLTVFYSMYFIFVLFGSIILFTWKDIIISLKRKLKPKGCDVYIINNSRQMSHSYEIPKEGIFWINKKPYVTNPNKLMSIDEKVYANTKKKLQERKKQISNKILEFQKKLKSLEIELKNAESQQKTELINTINVMIENINQRITNLAEDLESGEEYFYSRKRASFFYIEGDPVPKNFFSEYSQLDCDIIDNVIASSLTKDPKAFKDFDATIKKLKLLLYVSAGASAIAVVLLFQIVQKGVACTSGVI